MVWEQFGELLTSLLSVYHKWNISTSSRIFSLQISFSKIRSRLFIVWTLSVLFTDYILWISRSVRSGLLRFASLGGCGRMLSCHLPAFKALRVGSPGRSDTPSLHQSHRFSALHHYHSSPPPSSSSSFTLLLSSDDFCIRAAEFSGAAYFV